MRLDRLKLRNFRGFESLEISFHRQFTVLLGENMAGKSAVLDAAALACGAHVFSPVDMRHAIGLDDVRRVVTLINDVPDLQLIYPVLIEASGELPERGHHTTWELARQESDFAASSTLQPYRDGIAPAKLSLSLLARFGVQRGWHSRTESEESRGIGSREDAYLGCLDAASTYGALVGWIRKQTLIQLQRGNIQPQLAVVEAAVKCCIEHVRRFWFDVQYDELRLERDNGAIQTFSMLSEGVRNMVSMVAEIAWRAAVLNPQYGVNAHLETAGVVLIDEIDLHLHPAWQRRIIGDLRRTFPRIQFVVTTHSPQIVASVTRDQIRVLDANRLVADAAYVEGRNSNEILEDIFDVPARPETAQAEIDQLYRLLDDEQFAVARRQLAILEERLGPNDKDILRAHWILDTEDSPQAAAP